MEIKQNLSLHTADGVPVQRDQEILAQRKELLENSKDPATKILELLKVAASEGQLRRAIHEHTSQHQYDIGIIDDLHDMMNTIYATYFAPVPEMDTVVDLGDGIKVFQASRVRRANHPDSMQQPVALLRSALYSIHSTQANVWASNYVIVDSQSSNLPGGSALRESAAGSLEAAGKYLINSLAYYLDTLNSWSGSAPSA